MTADQEHIDITTDELLKGLAKHPESEIEAHLFAVKLAKRRIAKERNTEHDR